MELMKEYALLGSIIVLALLTLAALVRAMLGPRFTDRIIAVNLLNTLVTAMFALMAVWLQEDFLIDVALVYSLLSFLAVVVAARLVIIARRVELERKAVEGGKAK